MTDTLLAGFSRRLRLASDALRLPVWWPLALSAVLGMLCGAAYGVLQTPQYTTTGYVVVAPEKAADPMTALGYAHAYGRVVTNSAVLGHAQEATGKPAAELRTHIQAATSPDAPMIEIIGSDTRAEQSATNANEVARALTEYANASANSTGVRLSVLSKAPVPDAPTSPSAMIAAAVGTCAGGLLGFLIVLVRPGSRSRKISGVPAPAGERQASAGPERQLAEEGAR
ncbi:lipopolysaccharide biosynthesis protein [Streptomyces sp. NPDC004647]|uniref:YveK family protein n=1 Tax=Streptomyces sp. NPDC004647 TaxID=3154671 RepID=UPI0033B44DB8